MGMCIHKIYSHGMGKDRKDPSNNNDKQFI